MPSKFQKGQRVHYDTVRLNDGERTVDDGEILHVYPTYLQVTSDRGNIVQLVKKKGVTIVGKIERREIAPEKPPMRTFKDVPIRVLLDAFGGTDQSDYDENTNLLNYTGEAANGFIKEWIESEFDLDEVDRNEIDNVIRDSVQQKIDENVSHSMFVKVLRSAEDALCSSLEQAHVPHEISNNEQKGTLTISVEQDAIVRAWAEKTEGMGFVAWDPTLTAKDIISIVSLVSILDGRAEVYGYSPMKRTYDDDFDRFDPDTGTYYDLDKIARNAWKKHLREKHKAGTKHISRKNENLEDALSDAYADHELARVRFMDEPSNEKLEKKFHATRVAIKRAQAKLDIATHRH